MDSDAAAEEAKLLRLCVRASFSEATADEIDEVIRRFRKMILSVAE